MARTRTTPTARLTPAYGTSSGTNPGEDFEAPEDLSDIAGIDAEIPRGNARPTGSLLQPKPKPRSPIGVEIGKSAGGGLGVVVALPLGAGPISGRGGINLGAGGSIKGGSLGLGFGLGPIGGSIDVGTDQDEEGRGGCYQYVTVTVGPFSHTYGRNVCEPKPPPLGSPPPPSTSLPTVGAKVPLGHLAGCRAQEIQTSFMQGGVEYFLTPRFRSSSILTKTSYFEAVLNLEEKSDIMVRTETIGGVRYYVGNQIFTIHKIVNLIVNFDITLREITYKVFVTEARVLFSDGIDAVYTALAGVAPKLKEQALHHIDIDCSAVTPNPLVNIPTIPPLLIPNPPPKKKMDDCCKKVMPLLGEILRLLGRPVGPDGLGPMTGAAGTLGEKIKRIETPITDGKRPKQIEIGFTSIYQLLMYALEQANNLDTALDPKSYKIPSGYIPNPDYSRDSEHSLKDNSQPNKDKNGNDRELEINESDRAKMGGFLEQQQYIFSALKRLEYLFPFGELSDAVIAKDLLIPGGKGDIKIHNMIMAYELQMMYLNATFGNPREVVTIKDANPAIEGDQPIEVSALTLSDWFRQVIKFQVDTGGDVDAAVNLMLRDFRTNLANRTDIIKTAEMTQALFEDSGMREQQDYIKVHLEGDPYAGQWVKGQGFKSNPDLEKKTEEATEKVLRETMKPTEIKLKVSRRHKEEKTDMRDLLRGLADFVQRLLSVPTAGDAGTAIDKLIESAKFKVQTEAALLRQNITKAATASRNRTRKRKK